MTKDYPVFIEVYHLIHPYSIAGAFYAPGLKRVESMTTQWMLYENIDALAKQGYLESYYTDRDGNIMIVLIEQDLSGVFVICTDLPTS